MATLKTSTIIGDLKVTGKIEGYVRGEDVAAAIHFVGTVDYSDQLPTDGSEKKGAVYIVKYKGTSGTESLNAEYICITDTSTSSESWEELGNTAALDNYYTKDQVDTLISEESSDRSDADEVLQGNIDSIYKIDGESESGILVDKIKSLDYEGSTEGYYVTQVTETDGVIEVTRESKGEVSSESTQLVDGATVYTETIKKADKVSNATSGNFAGLDANGNLTDSGKKAADFVEYSQGNTSHGKVLQVNSEGKLSLVGADPNKVFAGPSESVTLDEDKVPSFRSLVEADIPGDMAVSKIKFGTGEFSTNHVVSVKSVNESGYIEANNNDSIILPKKIDIYLDDNTYVSLQTSYEDKDGDGIENKILSCDGSFIADKVYNAVWNDLADAVSVDDQCSLEPGYAYSFDRTRYFKSSKYADKRVIGIHSDTAGFVIGRKGEGIKTLNTAVAGFVLAHVDKTYPVGTPLTCTKEGKLTRARLLTRVLHPERVLGTFWKEEIHLYWGPEGHEIEVLGRKWVKIK